MAMIDDPTAVAFCNEDIRPAADALAQLYYLGKAVIDRWTAIGGTDMIPSTGDIVDDGADQDGRPVITGLQANRIKTRLSEIIDAWEANNNAQLKTILEVAVNYRE